MTTLQTTHATIKDALQAKAQATGGSAYEDFTAQIERAAALYSFQEFMTTRADNTRRRYASELGRFANWLGVSGDMSQDLGAWAGLSFGVVKAYAKELLDTGYSIGTVNSHLATIRTFATHAARFGSIDAQTLAKIKLVRGYTKKEGKRLDTGRAVDRIGAKKAAPVRLSADLLDKMVNRQPSGAVGRRDALILAMLGFLGLRVSELVLLDVDNISIEEMTVTFYRPKVDTTQTHSLEQHPALAAAVLAYVGRDVSDGALFPSARKGGTLASGRASIRGLNKRVGSLGALFGVSKLSPHDLRHAWATRAARNGTGLIDLMHAGGWTSPAMPARYIEAARVSNQGVML